MKTAMDGHTREEGLEHQLRTQLWADRWYNKIPLLRALGKQRPSRRGKFFRYLSIYGPALFSLGSLVCLATGLFFDKFVMLRWIQYWLIFCGTIQIASAAYMDVDRVIFLGRLKSQEAAKPTVYVREVMQIRFLLSVIEKLKAYREMSETEKHSAGDEISYLRQIYQAQEEDKRTPGGRMHHLGQEDLASLFMGASFNVTYGTILVLIGTFVALLRELLQHC